MITAVLLTAGLSSRMPGKNKMFLHFGNTTILKHLLAELYVSKIDEIVIVSDSAEHANDLAIFANVKLHVNPNPSHGMTSSIQIGVRNADHKSNYLICLGDMPLLTSNDYNKLINSYLSGNEQSIIKPVYQGKPGNPILFANSFREQILALKAADGCKPIVELNAKQVVEEPMPTDSIHFDIDTEEDYMELLSRYNPS